MWNQSNLKSFNCDEMKATLYNINQYSLTHTCISDFLQPEAVEEIRINIQETNHNRSPTRYIGDYAVFELLGKGAFGSVYKVCRKSAGQTFLAMKEVSVKDQGFCIEKLCPRERERN